MQISCFRNFRSKKPGSSTLEAIAEYIRTDRSLAQITALYRKDGSKTIKEESPLFAVAATTKPVCWAWSPTASARTWGVCRGLAHDPGVHFFPSAPMAGWQDGQAVSHSPVYAGRNSRH